MKTYQTTLILSILLAFAGQLHSQFSFTNNTSLLHNPNSFESGVAVAVADMDNDGKDDIIRLDDGNKLSIEYQQGSGQPFSHSFLSASVGLPWALAVADANNDGVCDMIMGGVYDDVKLIQSINNGAGYITSTLPSSGIFVQGSNFADIDNDGLLDIFTCHDDAESRIWENNGNGTFSTADDWIDMATTPPSNNSGNYGSTWTDFDNDGDIDLYIAKCRIGATSTTDPRRINALFVNDGQGNFIEAADEYGLKIGWQSWAADFQDIDNDGDLDCLVANHDHHLQLLENDGTGHFTDISVAAGLSSYFGNFYQCTMRDFDNDGFIDILTAAPSFLIQNNGDKTFSQKTNPMGGVNSFAQGDLNHDGFTDVYAVYQCGITSPCGNPDKLWINDGNSHHFLSVRLKGIVSNYKGVGAKVIIHGSWGVQVREIRAGESYGISNSLTALFGLGDETEITSVQVQWSSGIVDAINNPSADQFLLIEEGSTCVTESFAGSGVFEARPDAALRVDGITCTSGSPFISLTICNLGSDELPTNLPISFYQNDPQQLGAELLTTAHTDMAIAPSSCGTFSFSVNALNGSTIFAVANDDGSLPPPFSLADDFPSTTQDECDFENNIHSIAFEYLPLKLDLGDNIALCNVNEVALEAGTQFYQYAWQDGSTEPIFTATSTGTYFVFAWDVCGYRQSDTVEVELTQVAPIELGDDIALCFGEVATLSVTGYSNVQWSPAIGLSCPGCQSTAALFDTTSVVHVTAFEGNCMSEDSITISIVSLPDISLTTADSECDTPAAITAIANSGMPVFIWSNGQTGATINPTQSGIYSVTAVDGMGCQTIDSASVIVHENLSFETFHSDAACFGETSGGIILVVNGGEDPFQFLWSNGETTKDITGIPSGNYTVTITDANGCTEETMTAVDNPPSLSIEPQITPIPCADGLGQIGLDVSGGTLPYTFLWSNGETTKDIMGIPSGNYTATITDANGCTEETTEVVGNPPSLSIEPQITAILCANGLGQIDLDMSGGTSPYTFLWSNGETTKDITDISSGNYTVTITDANGCTETTLAAMDSPPSLSIEPQITPIPCANGLGQIGLDVSGGTLPYTFLWSNGADTQNLENVLAGSYSVTMTDANQCEETRFFDLTEPAALIVEGNSSDIDCSLLNGTGTASLTATGGTPPLSYLWSNAETTPSISPALPGVYTATVTDANGCQKDFSATVDLMGSLQTTSGISPISCHPNNGTATDGAAFIQSVQGVAPIHYLWENGLTDSITTNLGAGSYEVTVTDAIGCSAIDSFTMVLPTALTFETSSTDLLCFDMPTGQAQVVANGGTPGYSFLWDNGTTTPNVDGLFAGLYSVAITDSLGCQGSTTVTVGSPPLLELGINAEPSGLCPDETGNLKAIANGGMMPYSFLWDNMQTDSFLVNAPTGEYAVLVTDANGCMANDTIVLVEISTPIFIQDTTQAATGATNADGAIFINEILGGTSPFTFEWSNGDTTQSIDNLLFGFYSALITDAAGCVFSKEFEVGIMVGTNETDDVLFGVSLYPNPISEMEVATLSIRSPFLQKIEMALFDVQGRRLVMEQWAHVGGGQLFSLKAPAVAGVYIVQVKDGNGNGVYLKWVVTGK